MNRLAILAVIAIGTLATTPAFAEPFQITSDSFQDNEILNKKHAGNLQGNADCVGENISPQFKWVNAPPETKSFAFLMIDPEGLAPVGVAHWVAYGIPAATTEFKEGDLGDVSDKYVGGKSTIGVPNYVGPCTPAGIGFHHYTFLLMATDLEPSALKPGLTREELNLALDGHVKGSTAIVGRFGRP